ncbi:MAG: serine kinase [Candidatus Aminicenantes bacterium]|nr:serine kinase [Candidatus Aminicenantes bacterium]
MKLKEITDKLGLKVFNPETSLDVDVNSGYSSDLLSDVMANSKKGQVWITLQIHQNIIAVAKLKDLAGIILVNDRKPEEVTLEKAKEEGIPLLSTPETTFTISGKLYRLIGADK